MSWDHLLLDEQWKWWENPADLSVLRDGGNRGAPPEMRVLKPRNNSGEREGVAFFHLSNKPCLVASLEVIVFVLDLFLWTPFLVWDCLYGAVDEPLIHVFSSTQERGQGENG